jgi:hypothetical protein
MSRLAILVCFLLSVISAECQDLWVRPEKYFYEPNQTANVALLKGENFIGVSVEFRREDVQSLDMIYRSAKTDIRRNFTEGNKAFFTASLSADGIYQFLLQCKQNQAFFTRDQFAAYVKQYGLEGVYNDTSRIRSVDSVGISLTQVVKSYVRVGKIFDRRPENDAGLPLEIIPDKNPLTLDKGDRITFTVKKNGKPAFGVRVTIWNRWNNRTTIQHIYTLQDGTVSTSISSPGDWMATVVTVERGSETNQYIAESFNLVFGYR